MALGLPCLATDCGGVSEAVPDGVCGLLVPPGDATALAAAMARLARDGALRDALGRAGRQRAEQLDSLPAMIAAYEALWDRLLGIKNRA
jgi:glycosyltransferase involved in cell wall biosynthesis